MYSDAPNYRHSLFFFIYFYHFIYLEDLQLTKNVDKFNFSH